VDAPATAFLPPTVDVQAGGTVTWTFASLNHDVTFTLAAGVPADVPVFQNGSASRTFSSNGTFGYHCSIHPQMNGVVTVH
jgi:plastocyanin